MLSNIAQILLTVVAIVMGSLSCYFLTKKIIVEQQKSKSKQKLKASIGIVEKEFVKGFVCSGLALKVLGYMIKLCFSFSFSGEGKRLTYKFVKSNELNPKLKQLANYAGMSANFGNFVLKETQFRLAFICACAGLIIGMIFSNMLACILFILGCVLGLKLPTWAMKQEKTERSKNLEKNLPEMLEVTSLGLRSGLSFDRSLIIYTDHFYNQFAKSCSVAQKKWESGIKTREEALRDLSNNYDSMLFKRVVENIIRSLRFGSSLVESLEEAAEEARIDYKTSQEELVAKAPVKMMIPTGTLILPAMLLLVLGPVLLELTSGF